MQVTGVGPLEALSQHLADPINTTIFSKAAIVPGAISQPPCAIEPVHNFQVSPRTLRKLLCVDSQRGVQETEVLLPVQRPLCGLTCPDEDLLSQQSRQCPCAADGVGNALFGSFSKLFLRLSFREEQMSPLMQCAECLVWINRA